MVDIKKELPHYAEPLRGGVVFCNCGDSYESNFFKYFRSNFNSLGLKKLVAASYSEDGGLPFDGRRNPAYKIGVTQEGEYAQELLGNGDYASEECVELLKQSDFVITNPPFSKFRDYMSMLLDSGKRFLVLGPLLAATYKDLRPHIVNGELRLGHNNGSKKKWFQVPHEYEIKTQNVVKVENGAKYIGSWNSVWWTNMPVGRSWLPLTKEYEPENYPTYDGSDIIEVNRVENIPKNYTGKMGVPITFLLKHNPQQFSLVEPGLGRFFLDGKELFSRLVIQNKRRVLC